MNDNNINEGEIKVNFSDRFIGRMLINKYRKFIKYGIIIEDFSFPVKYRNLATILPDCENRISKHPYQNMFIIKLSTPETFMGNFEYNGIKLGELNKEESAKMVETMCRDFREELENIIYSPMKKEIFQAYRKEKRCGVVVMFKMRNDMDLVSNDWQDDDVDVTMEFFDETAKEVFDEIEKDENGGSDEWEIV